MNTTSLFNRRFKRFSSATLVGVMVTLLATACGESKVAQCNKLIDVINKGEEIDQKFEDEAAALAGFDKAESFEDFKTAAGEMSTAFGAIAEDVTTYLKEVDVVELADEELVGYRDAYAAEGESFSGFIGNASDLFDQVSQLEETPEGYQQLTELAAGFNEFSTDVDASSARIDDIIDDINGYCGVTPEGAAESTEDGAESTEKSSDEE